MRRESPLLLAALVSALSCAGPRPPALEARPGAPPSFDGLLVHPLPHDPLREAYYEAALAQRRDVAPTLPPDAGAETLREGFSPWLRRRADGLRALAERIPALDARSPDDAVFAAVLYATVADELREAVRSLPAPPGLDADAATLWRETRDQQVRPLARHARDAWTRCVTMLPSASAALRAWEPRCTGRVETLVAMIAAEPRPQRPRPQRITLPAACEGPEYRAPPQDPEAPPPDERAPRAIAVVHDESRFQGAALTRLLTPLRAWIARTPGARLVPQNEVETARLLRTQRRWRSGGPVCGQSPPLPALLAARYPNLVIAAVSTWCGELHPDAPDGGVDGGTRPLCTLSVNFRRAGSDDRAGLPAFRSVDVPGPEGDVESWVRAAMALADPGAGPSLAGLLGSLGRGEGPVLRVLGHAQVDPWLRVGPTLGGHGDQSARAALEACAPRGGGVGVYELAWTLTPEGVARDVSVSTAAEPRSGGAEVAACVRDVLTRTGFPCPRDGATASARARLCLGWM